MKLIQIILENCYFFYSLLPLFCESFRTSIYDKYYKFSVVEEFGGSGNIYIS